MSKRPQVALCMIVRNEAERLARCLESAAPAVDAIYITDTGSRDRTVAIAREFQAHVRKFAWRNDFAAARNASLRGVTADWILILDADDWFPPGEALKLRRCLTGGRPAALALRYEAVCGYTPVWARRVFRNHPGLKFEGLVHEHLRRSLAARLNATTRRAPVRLVHEGGEAGRLPEKLRRYLPLLRREFRRATRAGDGLQRLHVGRELAMAMLLHGRAKAGENLLAKLMREIAFAGGRISADQESIELSVLAAWHWWLLKQERSAQAYQLCCRYATRFEDLLAFRLLRGVAALHAREDRAALADLQWVKSRSRRVAPEISLPARHLGVDLDYWLAQCYQKQGRYAQARECLERCAKAEPDQLEYRARLRLLDLLAQSFHGEVNV